MGNHISQPDFSAFKHDCFFGLFTSSFPSLLLSRFLTLTPKFYHFSSFSVTPPMHFLCTLFVCECVFHDNKLSSCIHSSSGGAVHLKTALLKSCCQRAVEPRSERDVWMTNWRTFHNCFLDVLWTCSPWTLSVTVQSICLYVLLDYLRFNIGNVHLYV